MKKSVFDKLIFVLLAAFLLVAVSCSKKAAGGAVVGSDGKPITAEELEKATGDLLYWSGFQGDSLIWDNWRVEEFKKLYPNINVNLQSVPESAGMKNGMLMASIAGGTPPDTLVADDYVSAYGFAGQGALEPWDPYLEALGLSIDDFMPGFRDLMQYNGKTYLLPQDSNVIMLYINTDMVKEAGLDINDAPTNLEELRDWADKLTVRSGNQITRYGFIPWVDYPFDSPTMWPFMFGADIYNNKTGKLELTDPRIVASFNWMREWANDYDPVATRGFSQTAGGFFSPDHPFFQGRLAMTVTGNWVTNAIRIYAPDLNYTVVPIPVPAGGRERSTPLGSNVYVLPKGAKRPDLAALWFKFTQRPEINADNFDNWRSVPTIDSIFDEVSWTKANDPIYKLEREIANSPKSGHPALCAVSAELNRSLTALMDDVIFNRTDPLPLLQTLQDRLQPELDKAASAGK